MEFSPKEYKKETYGAVSTLEPTTTSMMPISLALGEESGAYLFCFQDLVTIGLLFFSEGTSLQSLEDKRNQLENLISSSIGEAQS